MNTWTIDRYRRPYLNVDRITLSRGSVVLRQGGTSYDVSVSGGGPQLAHVAALLRDLRREDSPRWPDIRGNANGLRGMLNELDRAGLIGEADRDVDRVVSSQASELRQHAVMAADWVVSAIDGRRHPRAKTAARALSHTVDRLLRGRKLPPSAIDTGSFYRDIQARQLRCWSRTAPLSLVAVEVMLRRLSGACDDGSMSAVSRQIVRRQSGGMFDSAILCAHIDGAAVLFAQSLRSEQRRVCEVPDTTIPRSGISLMLAGERLAAAWLRRLGESTLQKTLHDGSISRRLGRGIYIEQFHLSRRFVEVLTAIMQRQLRPDLRALVYQYYGEEVGHEVFEREAALSVGVTDAELDRSRQLPLFGAYLDVLTDMSEMNPIGLLLSLLVAEGFPGTSTPVNEGLERAGLAATGEAIRRHERLNVELHHSTAPRVLMAAIPSVAPEVQSEALRDLALMVELNFRAWNMLHRYYSNERLPFPYSGITEQGVGARAFG